LSPHENIDENINANLLSGIMIIHRVFECAFIKTKNIDSTYYYSNDAFTYYLEYVGQMQRANFFKAGNDTDTLLFVYKKTLFELFDSENSAESSNSSIELGGKSILTNILTASTNNTPLNHISNLGFNDFFALLKKITNLLLLRNESFKDNDKPAYIVRIEICQKFLEPFLKNIEKMEFIIDRIEILQEHLDFPNQVWREIFKELLLEISKTQRKKTNTDVKDFLIVFHNERAELQEKCDIKEIIRRIFLHP
jgi:hypothetical protein